jgi:hypothetical protein
MLPGPEPSDAHPLSAYNQTIHHSTRCIDMLGRVTGMVSRAPDPADNGNIRIIASAGHHYDPRGRRQNTRREDGTKWEYSFTFWRGISSRKPPRSSLPKISGHWPPT